MAIELVLHAMVRTEDLRGATWSEVGRDQWRIPAEQMKMWLEHIVPLTPTSRRLLEQLRELSGGSRLIVPGEKPGKWISQNTMIYALYRMGYHGRLTIHGFRRAASTILNETRLLGAGLESSGNSPMSRSTRFAVPTMPRSTSSIEPA